MTEVSEMNASELLAAGRRHLAVRDWSSAVETLAKACELLAAEHGDMADQCAEAYLWYGKSLLGLAREESGVLGDGVPGTNEAEGEDDDEESGEEENGEAQEAEAKDNKEPKENGDAANEDAQTASGDAVTTAKENGESTAMESADGDKTEPQSTTVKAQPSSSKMDDAEPGLSNDDAGDESTMMDNDDVDNLQLAWEMLDLARSILSRRSQDSRALLADVHLALGEVALESETYDKAVIDMQSCLEIQKELYHSSDRRIAETHYQIGLANSLASNFEEAITHFKNAANILESRIKTLENPTAATEDATVKKYTSADPLYSVEGEIKELKELLPEIQEKIQDMMDYKAETIKRVRETLFSSNGSGPSTSNGAGSSSTSTSSVEQKPVSNISHLIKRLPLKKVSEGETDSPAMEQKPVSNISHLVKRKRKVSEGETDSPAKKPAVDT